MVYRKAEVNIERKGNLENLVGEAKKGNTDAFREIFDQFVDKLYGYALSRTSNRQDALDIVQETFVDLWSAIEKFKYKSEAEFSGFVFKILKRKIAKRYAKKRDDVSIENLDLGDGYRMEIEDYRYVVRGVDGLPKKYGEVVRLRYWSDLSFKEIAEMLNINEGAAKVRHQRAVEKLKEKLVDK